MSGLSGYSASSGSSGLLPAAGGWPAPSQPWGAAPAATAANPFMVRRWY